MVAAASSWSAIWRRLGLGTAIWLACAGAASAQVQNVWVDFDFDVDAGEFVYSSAERDAVIARANGIYADYNVNFSRTDPGGTRAVIRIGVDGVTGGVASDIDFRNLSLSGTADVNTSNLESQANRALYVSLTGLIVAHETGHLLGLRHFDSFGAIGNGRPTTVAAGSFSPSYPGPATATETTRRLMASPASVGQTIAEAEGPINIGEREAVKLTIAGLARNGQAALTPINEQGGAHGTAGTAQAVTFTSINVPNSLPSGAVNFGKNFLVDTFVVSGSISAGGQQDFYSFNATAGDLIFAEVVSSVVGRFSGNNIDSLIAFTNAAGTVLTDYYGTSATNDDEESTDARMFDYIISATGTQFVRVTAFSAADTGNYELFVYRFRAVAVPEPGTLALFGLVGVGGLAVRRWRKLQKAC